MGYYTKHIARINLKGDLDLQKIKQIKNELSKGFFDYEDGECYRVLELGDSLETITITEEGIKAYNLDKELIHFQSFLKALGVSMDGVIDCQGEDFEDVYKWVLQNNTAEKVQITPEGEKIMCPHCEQYFYN